ALSVRAAQCHFGLVPGRLSQRDRRPGGRREPCRRGRDRGSRGSAEGRRGAVAAAFDRRLHRRQPRRQPAAVPREDRAMRTLLPALLCIPLLASAQTANEYLPAGSMVDPQSCHYDFIDIAASGTPLAMTAAGNPAADDDGAALLPLQAPMPLLGESLDA